MSGIRDQGLIESGLARRRNLAAYGDPDVFDLASAYAAGISDSQGFLDGNQRTGYILARLFRIDHGDDIRCSPQEKIDAMLQLASGGMSQKVFGEWLRRCSVILSYEQDGL